LGSYIVLVALPVCPSPLQLHPTAPAPLAPPSAPPAAALCCWRSSIDATNTLAASSSHFAPSTRSVALLTRGPEDLQVGLLALTSRGHSLSPFSLFVVPNRKGMSGCNSGAAIFLRSTSSPLASSIRLRLQRALSDDSPAHTTFKGCERGKFEVRGEN
jgi:hypothetical protein